MWDVWHRPRGGRGQRGECGPPRMPCPVVQHHSHTFHERGLHGDQRLHDQSLRKKAGTSQEGHSHGRRGRCVCRGCCKAHGGVLHSALPASVDPPPRRRASPLTALGTRSAAHYPPAIWKRPPRLPPQRCNPPPPPVLSAVGRRPRFWEHHRTPCAWMAGLRGIRPLGHCKGAIRTANPSPGPPRDPGGGAWPSPTCQSMSPLGHLHSG